MSDLAQYVLHACPFCGCEELSLGGNASEGDVHIRCANCGAQGPGTPFVWASVDGWESRTSFPDEPRYTITPAGREHLDGKA
jgi:hypothetical protein